MIGLIGSIDREDVKMKSSKKDEATAKPKTRKIQNTSQIKIGPGIQQADKTTDSSRQERNVTDLKPEKNK